MGGDALGTGRNLAFRGGVVAVAIGLALIAWLVSRGSDEEAAGDESSARIVTESELRSAAAKLPFAVYWAGPDPAAELELVQSPTGVLIRYVKSDREEVEELAIGSYPVPNPDGVLGEFASRPSSSVADGPGGREVVFNADQPTSVYFADQVGGVQVEVYDPLPSRALALARSARVRPLP